MNPFGARICRHCAALLTDAPVAPTRIPWWRLLLRWLRRAVSRLRFPRRLLTTIVVLALVAAAVMAAMRLGPTAVDAIRDKMATPAPIQPTAVTASSEAPDHPAHAAVDGLSNRYWSPSATGDGAGQYLEATFAEPFRLLELIVRTGASPRQDEFVAQPRVAVLDVQVRTADGQSRTFELRLADKPDEQHFREAIGGVVAVRMTVRGGYGTAANRSVALAEVEFFRRP